MRLEARSRAQLRIPAMHTETPFEAALEAVDRLSLEEQESVVEILHRRVVERRREELVGEIREAEAEYEAGETGPISPQELIDEITE
jgi:hypothetical protein